MSKHHQIYDERFMLLMEALLKMASANFPFRVPISDAKDANDILALLINNASFHLNRMFHQMKISQVFIRPKIIFLINAKKQLLTHSDGDHQIIAGASALLSLTELLSQKSKGKFLKNWKNWNKETESCYDLGILDFKGISGLFIPLHIQVIQSSELLDDPLYYIMGFDPQQPVPPIQPEEIDQVAPSDNNKKVKPNSKTISDFLLAERVHNVLMKFQNSPIPTLSTIASEAGGSVSRIQRAFKDRYHMSVLSFDMQKRLEASTFLLERTNLNMKRVAAQYGFKTSSHYIKRFRQEYKITPFQYRKNLFLKNNQ